MGRVWCSYYSSLAILTLLLDNIFNGFGRNYGYCIYSPQPSLFRIDLCQLNGPKRPAVKFYCLDSCEGIYSRLQKRLLLFINSNRRISSKHHLNYFSRLQGTWCEYECLWSNFCGYTRPLLTQILYIGLLQVWAYGNQILFDMINRIFWYSLMGIKGSIGFSRRLSDRRKGLIFAL